MRRRNVRASSFGIALIAAGVAGMILGLVGAHIGNTTVGEPLGSAPSSWSCLRHRGVHPAHLRTLF